MRPLNKPNRRKNRTESSFFRWPPLAAFVSPLDRRCDFRAYFREFRVAGARRGCLRAGTGLYPSFALAILILMLDSDSALRLLCHCRTPAAQALPNRTCPCNDRADNNGWPKNWDADHDTKQRPRNSPDNSPQNHKLLMIAFPGKHFLTKVSHEARIYNASKFALKKLSNHLVSFSMHDDALFSISLINNDWHLFLALLVITCVRVVESRKRVSPSFVSDFATMPSSAVLHLSRASAMRARICDRKLSNRLSRSVPPFLSPPAPSPPSRRS